MVSVGLSPTGMVAETDDVGRDMANQDTSVFTTGDGCAIAYRIDGPSRAPVLVLSNSIGTTHTMWNAQVPALSERFRVLRYDTRGHGGSSAPAGPYSMDRLGFDVIELLDAVEIERAHFCGLSLGGFIGQWLAVHRPDRIDRLVLANTASYLEPRSYWDEQITAVLAAPDLTETAEFFLRHWFPASFLETAGDIVAPLRQDLLNTSPNGLAGCWAAIRDAALRRVITHIDLPTLVIAGEHDTVISVEDGQRIAAAIPGARLSVFPVVHLTNIERPAEFLDVVLDFLSGD